MGEITGLLADYFIDPIVNGTGYNVINTLSFAFMLVAALVVIDMVFGRMRIRLDKRLWWRLMPLVVLGGTLRALQDVHFFSFMGVFQYALVTPMIYFTLSIAAALLIFADRATGKNILLGAGAFLASFFLTFTVLMGHNFEGLAIALALTAAVFAATWALFRKTKLMARENASAILAHALDACSSVTAISILGTFREQHVLPNIIFSYLPFPFFIPLKIGLALLAVHVIDKETKGNWNWLLKFTVLVLGMGPGIRNALAILMSL